MSTVMTEVLNEHDKDIRCPHCDAAPGEPCHVKGDTSRVRHQVHDKRTAHLWAVYGYGWGEGYKRMQQQVSERP